MLPVADVWQVLVYYSTGNADLIIWYIRLPRVLAAIVCGAGLATAGVVMQSVLKNPLSSQYTPGVSQAAEFGAVVAIMSLGAGGKEVITAEMIDAVYGIPVTIER
ncbi:MAG: iron chelate uptake ABC transporter family permease subunit [Methanoregula sp.]|nr:iron chelate uptake ABC transporter family permease subunit [Methanoregula sp.]MDD5025333.1 iron chelate uptake ABC transporter family permease subunit [Methanoregula sp.]